MMITFNENMTVGAVAKEFALLMRLYLTGEQIYAVLDEPRAVHTCKTHDFIDANMVMLEALTAINGSQVEFVDELIPLIGAAWDMARDNRWYVQHDVNISTGYCDDCGGVCERVVDWMKKYNEMGYI